jgi:hypothetical protein
MATPATTTPATATVTVTASGTVEALIRLAWLAEVEKRPRLRDAMLTLAVAESGPGDAVLAERCRRLLVARRPDHWFATTATLGQALTNSRVAGALATLRSMFPPVRVQRMLLRGEAQRGPYTGRTTPLPQILEELGLAPERPVRDRRPRDPGPRALPFPTLAAEPDDSPAALYLATLFALAVLLHGALEQQQPDTHDGGIKAA